MDNFDICFKSFNYISEKSPNATEESDCCINQQNHEDCDGSIICRVCSKIISNILETAEWKNYGKSNSNTARCGLPVNVLLPKSSIGSCVPLNGKGTNM